MSESQQEYTAHFGKQTVKIIGNKSEEHIEEVVRRVNIALNEIKSKPSILSNQKMALLVAINATSHWLENEAEIASQREQIERLSRQKARLESELQALKQTIQQPNLTAFSEGGKLIQAKSQPSYSQASQNLLRESQNQVKAAKVSENKGQSSKKTSKQTKASQGKQKADPSVVYYDPFAAKKAQGLSKTPRD
ncbi:MULTISPECIES: cell division protein ZapA [Aerococcus]|uniref:cell division protein ZapA n=1 Tax=Aerococcus urinae (strain CCUG 59500 / ACS-120-V-Col10a) TaxID=2976812 RepID=UPI000200EA8C|nr:cell division protein ZapA [Aerococcus sp. Group 1]AEA00483.1 hypothetical protein HMPREF9243_0803 [Aerococcus sp. Group 1]MCY3031527.1 cell division protein ZapA [Aerococcus sp. Group 1]MCY3055686.1 cell division protein ZapA [Aerococcus sp. Group 1]MCY3057416.1 cell division protein ZapA [Aerococcus sp. Group 1]MCY3062648.1 cell division protein ZapA [Aerococcus sp. Group 1]